MARWPTKKAEHWKESYLVVDTFSVKIIEASDPLSKSEVFINAKKEEVTGLKKRNILRVVECDDVEEDANIMGGRFVLTP